MSKNPYSAGRLVAYGLLTLSIALGGAEGCGKKQPEPKCTLDRDGNMNCPMQSGRQDPLQ